MGLLTAVLGYRVSGITLLPDDANRRRNSLFSLGRRLWRCREEDLRADLSIRGVHGLFEVKKEVRDCEIVGKQRRCGGVPT